MQLNFDITQICVRDLNKNLLRFLNSYTDEEVNWDFVEYTDLLLDYRKVPREQIIELVKQAGKSASQAETYVDGFIARKWSVPVQFPVGKIPETGLVLGEETLTVETKTFTWE